ncbi:hypothetical protein [Caldivirga sp. MU80]|uniref:hypothetical protein n=1 Tax=Caldivirga sp. MU80 TaxID=1650354 RepID=UPI0008339942|nr:hypothetical protein [Caldivirga sp. MU80]
MKYSPEASLALAIALAVIDGVETYIGVILLGGVEEGQLTRAFISHYGVIGLVADDLLTVGIAVIFYLMARQGGVIGLIGLTTLNIANGLRMAVVASNAYVLIVGYTNIPLVVACGVIIGIVLNTPILRLIKEHPRLTHGPGTGLKTTG